MTTEVKPVGAVICLNAVCIQHKCLASLSLYSLYCKGSQTLLADAIPSLIHTFKLHDEISLYVSL